MDSTSIMTLASICLILFAITGMVDGSYWHLMKLKLHTVPESRYEHFTHTIRMCVFPFILFFLFTSNYGGWYFWGGDFCRTCWIALVFASKPLTAYNLSVHIIEPPYSDFSFWVAWIFFPGAILNGITHLWLCQKKYVVHN